MWKNLEYLTKRYKGSFSGSNGFGVSGNLTHSGKPLIANDPHIGHTIPCFWYPAEVLWTDPETGKDRFAIGTTVPGSPVFVVGRNDYGAWSVTLSEEDVLDFFEEKVDYETNTYLFDGEWIPIREIKHFIKISDGEDTYFKVKFTHHGPLLNHAFNALNGAFIMTGK